MQKTSSPVNRSNLRPVRSSGRANISTRHFQSAQARLVKAYWAKIKVGARSTGRSLAAMHSAMDSVVVIWVAATVPITQSA